MHTQTKHKGPRAKMLMNWPEMYFSFNKYHNMVIEPKLARQVDPGPSQPKT